MKKRMISVLLALFLSIGFILVASEATAEATFEYATGHMDNVVWTEFGEVWWADNTVHVRNRMVEWDSHATDPRLEGKIVDEYNVNINFNAPFPVAKFWGKMWINLEDGSYWEGTFNGEIVGGLQQGSGIVHGRGGSIDGLKAKIIFLQRAGAVPTVIDFEATILNPHGD